MRSAAALAAAALMTGFAVPAASADQIRDQQWALKTFEAEAKVWPVSQGDGVVVGVIDTGVSQDQPDLTGQVLPGADFSGGNSDGRVDTNGHGTGMASLIAGHGHASQAGVMGLAPKARILPVRVMTGGDGPDPEPTSDSQENGFAEAIRFAVDHGAKVVNISLGGNYRFDSKLRKSVSYAVSKDVVLVASTGNSGSSMGADYPAAFPGVVAVGAVDSNGTVWERSTSGVETTLAAPGVGIYRSAVTAQTGYERRSGTSDATAYVSATAALIRSKYPNLSAGQVISRMIKAATRPADGSVVPNNQYGYGIVAPAKALEANPAVDSGPRENPLIGRKESRGTPPPMDEATDDPSVEAVVPEGEGGSSSGIGFGVGVAIGLALWALLIGGVVVVVAFVVRARRRGRG
ncbi:type VII secretion-associated serine protease [Kitasatospora xanthocidica]|uniref:type VII secretion-associated serine protease mycosin n=1 Tax=Kitasatospora xanthocidica TaxID=83382 RepID=UPI001984871A|nr:type VII secretion-associated serine protease mycosin [Kitasatospora xanthocidica]GHF61581.1 type VII secretion-associated serine protease [Kitasatospora xanthocidica]